jgi:hypothetical protein
VSVLLDAGPALNFLAVGQQGVLIRAAELGGLQLSVPERVDREVLGMCRSTLFAATPAAATWRKLKVAGRVVVLPDALTTTAFADAVSHISGGDAEQPGAISAVSSAVSAVFGAVATEPRAQTGGAQRNPAVTRMR